MGSLAVQPCLRGFTAGTTRQPRHCDIDRNKPHLCSERDDANYVLESLLGACAVDPCRRNRCTQPTLYECQESSLHYLGRQCIILNEWGSPQWVQDDLIEDE